MNTNTESTINDADIDAELAELLQDTTTVTAARATTDEDLAEVESELAMQAIKDESYAEQAATEEVTGAAAPTPITAGKKGKKAPSSTPRVAVSSGAKPSEVIAAALPGAQLLKAACLVKGDAEDPAYAASVLEAVDKLPKKVALKAVNLLRHRTTPSKLENFTRIAMELLRTKRSFSSKELIAHFQSIKYSIGTARAQTSQIFSLLPTLRVSDRSGNTIAWNADSLIAQEFEAAAA